MNSFSRLVVSLATLVLLISWGVFSYAEPDRERVLDTDPPEYAPTHTQLYHQVIGIHETWVFWMTDRIRMASPIPFGPVETQLWLEDTHKCASAVDLEVLSTRLLINDAPFTDEWVTMIVVGELLAACDTYYNAREEE